MNSDPSVEGIIAAARHALRPDATEFELENDAPRILAYACRQGLEVKVRLREDIPIEEYENFQLNRRWLGDRLRPERWQDAACSIQSIKIEGKVVL